MPLATDADEITSAPGAPGADVVGGMHARMHVVGVQRRDVRFLAMVGLVLLSLQIVFLGLLFAAQTVPDDPIVSHLVEGIDEGIYGPTGRPDYMGGVAEAFTECVALGTGLGRPELGVWERTMRMPRLESCRLGEGQLRDSIAVRR